MESINTWLTQARKADRRGSYLDILRYGIVYLFPSAGYTSSSLSGSQCRGKGIEKLIESARIDSNSQDGSVLMAREQVLVAALDAGEFELADLLLKALRKQFPESSRVDRLEGLYYEATKKYDEAGYIYEAMLDRNSANTIAAKRKIAILFEKGKDIEGVNELNAYIRGNMGDDESWLMLANTYLLLGKFDLAAFCFEEVILAQPHNYAIHLLYSEAVLSSNKIDQYIDARKHLSQSLICKRENNARSAWGLLIGCVMVQQETLGAQAKKKGNDSENVELLEAQSLNKDVGLFAANLVVDTYKKGNAPKDIQAIMEKVVGKLKLSLE